MSYGPLTEEQARILQDMHRKLGARVYILQDAYKDAILENLSNIMLSRKIRTNQDKFIKMCKEDNEAYQIFLKSIKLDGLQE